MELKTIQQVFEKRILRVPSYQRGYSWGNNKEVSTVQSDSGALKNIKGQLADLWNDLTNMPPEAWHYTGLLTLVESPNQEYSWLNEYKQYEIVDGQQRITSILILISVMIDISERLEVELETGSRSAREQYLYITERSFDVYIFGYDSDNPSNKYFKRCILKVERPEDDSRESVYTENLKKAKIFFETMVQGYISNTKRFSSKKAGLQDLFELVTSGFKFNEYVLPPELDAYVVFETMNNRGKPLSQLEKLKNRLMYLSDKFKTVAIANEKKCHEHLVYEKNILIDSINTAWSTIYQELGANKEDPLPDDDFIKAHWIAYFERYNRSEANAYATNLFNEHFTIERIYDNSLSTAEIRKYVKSLQGSSIVWNKMHNPDSFIKAEERIKEAILGLHRVGFRVSFKPLVLAALNQPNKEEFVSLIELLEDYAFKVFHISDRQSNTGDSKLYRLAPKVNGSVEETNTFTATDACKKIHQYVDEYYSFSSFQNQIKELFELGGKRGFYGWSGIHYFLYSYDQKLREENSASRLSSVLNWQNFNASNTIEHIYPQSATKSYVEFYKSADKGKGKDTPERKKEYDRLQGNWLPFQDYSSEQKNRLCNSLGNLLAISHSDNASFSNDSFYHKSDLSRKGGTYKNRGYLHDSMSAQLVAKHEEWTPEAIKVRGVLMLKSLLKMLGEPEDKLSESELVRLLGLEFMLQESEG